MSVCFGVIVRVRIKHRCVCVAGVVLERFARGDPGVRFVSLALRSASCLDFPTGLYPFDCEGWIHYRVGRTGGSVFSPRHMGGRRVTRTECFRSIEA